MLPNFFVVGAYKSGTTSLHLYLEQHPEVYVSPVKEPNFFAFGAVGFADASMAFRKSVKTLAEYENLFERAAGFVAIGDVSPEYMTSTVAARAIRSKIPHAKLIAILRNPVERAYSDFLMYRRDGREPETDFLKALDQQAERAARADPTGHYVSSGFYGEQLARYYDIFPADQIKVVLMEDLEASGRHTLSQVCAFLGVDASFTPASLAIHNRSGEASNVLIRTIFQHKDFLAPIAKRVIPEGLRNSIRLKLESKLKKPSLRPDIKSMLAQTYGADVRLLERLTGKSCHHWLT